MVRSDPSVVQTAVDHQNALPASGSRQMESLLYRRSGGRSVESIGVVDGGRADQAPK
jgi:hypothetical protein